ncbi:MAG: M20/M25/M40 family metallo-hydrolase [Acidobacteria bacterium]|nr:M20/M25/M40 family metallo-hydrolase [Acidobacteriota bacterium]
MSVLPRLLGICVVVCACSPALVLAGQSDTDHVAAIRQLAARPDVRQALDLIPGLESDAEADLIELTEIAAPPFQESARASRFAEMLEGAGLSDVSIDEVGNVLARRRGSGTGETVAIVAHLDTVFPAGTDVTVRRRNDRLYAPGIGDDTRGLVLLLNVARALGRGGVRTRADILFVGSVGEEGLGDLRGVRHLFRRGGPRVDQLIAIDGGSDSRVVNQALGSRRYRVTVTGPGGHSWGDFGLANPVHALGRAIHYFDEAAAVIVKTEPAASYNVGRLGGGTSVNAVPHESWAEIDIRSVDPVQVDRIESALREAMTRALDQQNRARDRGDVLRAAFELIGDRPSGTVAAQTALVQRALAVTRMLGFAPQLGAASTDANVPIAQGLPAVTLGRGGSGGGAHALNEWWAPHDAHIAVQRALLVLVASAGVAD